MYYIDRFWYKVDGQDLPKKESFNVASMRNKSNAASGPYTLNKP